MNYSLVGPCKTLALWLSISIVLLFSKISLADSEILEVVKSSLDYKSYQAFTLKNGLQVLSISDPSATKSAASLTVAAGYYQDPLHLAGLSHLLEHVLFTGSKSYTRPSEIKNYFNSNGGRISATTRAEFTNYTIEIESDKLSSGLSRLANMIHEPLLHEKYIKGEIENVHSEYSSKYKDDWRRSQAVLKETMNNLHPNSKFSGGNSESLSTLSVDTLKEELVKFHSKYYTSNLMTLVVLSNQSHENMIKQINHRFERLSKGDESVKLVKVKRFLPEHLAQTISVKTFSNSETIDLRFPIANRYDTAGFDPAEYLAFLLKSQSKNTLYDFLKTNGLISSLSTNFHGDKSQGLFNVYINLTEKGSKNRDLVIKAFFDYIALLKEQKHPKELFDDLKRIKKLEFDYPRKINVGDLVEKLSLNMQLYKRQEWLTAKYIIEHLELPALNKLFEDIAPENMRILVNSSQVKATNKERFYNVDYRVDLFTEKQKSLWNSRSPQTKFSFPQLNPFLASDNPQIKEPAALAIAYSNSGITMWSATNEKRAYTSASLSLNIYDKSVSSSLKSDAKAKLFVELVKRKLAYDFHLAEQAGVEADFYSMIRGYRINLEGIQANQTNLLNVLLNNLLNFYISKEDFEKGKVSLVKSFSNAQYRKPFRQVQSAIYEEIYSDVYAKKDLGEAIAEIKHEDLVDWLKNNLRHVEIEGIYIGNVTKNEAKEVGEAIASKFAKRLSRGQKKDIRVAKLSKTQNLVRRMEVKHRDSSIAYLIQANDGKIETLAKYRLAKQLLSAYLFNELRTEKQLGYIFHINEFDSYRIPGMVIVLESSKYSPRKLKSEIEMGLKRYAAYLQTQTESDFNSYRDSLATTMEANQKVLSKRARQLRMQLDLDYTNFGNEDKLIEVIKEIKKSEFEDFVKSEYSKGKLNSLAVISYGEGHARFDKSECGFSKCLHNFLLRGKSSNYAY